MAAGSGLRAAARMPAATSPPVPLSSSDAETTAQSSAARHAAAGVGAVGAVPVLAVRACCQIHIHLTTSCLFCRVLSSRT